MSRYPMGFVSRECNTFLDIVYHLGSAYERCNLWPAYSSRVEFLETLCEEVQEAAAEANKLSRYSYYDCIKNASYYEFDMIRGMAIKVMLEAIQVVSVLDKYEVCKDIEHE